MTPAAFPLPGVDPAFVTSWLAVCAACMSQAQDLAPGGNAVTRT